jgi:tetratricopeptide (TPR) repeat protein
MRWLFVIARNSSFTYKGRAVDVKQVGRELGVRYVLEGSVRKGGDKIRITGQLINAETGAHIWADRFDGALEDVFELQDRVTASVVGAIAPKLEQAEIERVLRKPTENLDAYDFYLRGLSHLHRWTREDNDAALAEFTRATELDPKFAAAWGMAARCYAQKKVGGWTTDPARDIAETEQLARRALELGKDDAIALCTAGFALADVVGRVKDGDAFIERALALNRNLAWAWTFSGWSKIWLGKHDLAMDHVSRAMRLSPHDPHMFAMQAAMATAAYFSARYDEALNWAEMALRDKPDMFLALCVAASCHALAGRQAEAGREIARLLAIDPALRLSNLQDRYAVFSPDDLARWLDGLRKAGLSE